MREIQSGDWKKLPGTVDYVLGLIDDILIERLVWGPSADEQRLGKVAVAGPGYVWYRFWLWRDEQIVEKYFDPQGVLLGTQVDICMPFRALEDTWVTSDLLLDIWIAPDGAVTVRSEAVYEAAVKAGELSAGEAERAEQQIRRLTGAIAQGRFPPPLVRNWQVDARRIQETVAK